MKDLYRNLIDRTYISKRKIIAGSWWLTPIFLANQRQKAGELRSKPARANSS
jgi:hypothetical protein